MESQMQLPKDKAAEKEFLKRLGRDVSSRLTAEFESYTGLELPCKRKALIEQELAIMEGDFFESLNRAGALAKEAFRQNRYSNERTRFFNPQMDAKLNDLAKTWPSAASAFVLGGLLFQKHCAGIKTLYGMGGGQGDVIDVLSSASSISLGAHNPYITMLDRVEDALEVRDNICGAYHPGIRQAFFMEKMARLYPGGENRQVCLHSESSGSVVDSIAIESVLAFIEKRGGGTEARVLAVDGTWAGSYGVSREATGFTVSDFAVKRGGKALHVDRCLPSPTKENKDRFLALLAEKVKSGQAAALYLEPDIIGDSGIELVDRDTLKEALSVLKTRQLPFIADCVQQLGRTGSYWGENVDEILQGYPHLVVTTAKSASNGQAFGFVIMPKEIADSAYPLSQLTTNQFNGPLLRAVCACEILKDDTFQRWLAFKALKIEEVAAGYGIPLGEKGLRGKFLNRGIYVGSNENVKLAQIALLAEDGVLVGALPQSLRYQPVLTDYADTNELVAHVIFRRVSEVMKGNHSKHVLEIYEKMRHTDTGLARA